MDKLQFQASQTSTKFRVFPDKVPEKFEPRGLGIYGDRSEDEKFFEHPKDLIQSLRQYRTHHCHAVLQTTKFTRQTIASKNGFVRTVVDCYNDHHNLIIRPDDIWAAIMTQFSFYVNANAEEFRGKFVNFEGKKGLIVEIPSSLYTAPYDLFVTLMSEAIDRNLVDPEVKDWILPNFSTTTESDRVSIGVVFMATMKKYFNYTFSGGCGIPWITLEGTVQDWEVIYWRLSKLKSYKLERWCNMLERILKQFVNAKKGNVDLDFWQRISTESRGGSGDDFISGWLSVFCAFDKDGNWQGSVTKAEGEGEHKWLKIYNSQIPPGIVEVDVKLKDFDKIGTEYYSVLFAGHMAREVLEDGLSLKPTLGWSISLKPDPKEMEKIDKEEEEELKYRYGYLQFR